MKVECAMQNELINGLATNHSPGCPLTWTKTNVGSRCWRNGVIFQINVLWWMSIKDAYRPRVSVIARFSKEGCMSQPHFGQVWGWSPTLGKVEGLEPSRTPECLELVSKAQKTSHWRVLGVIAKVLKRRYRKWPRIGNSNICSPSYGQKKGRESNWQFDSRPLKVGNRPLPNVALKSATWL